MAACAGANKSTNTHELVQVEGSPNLFLGHSQSGEIVVAASHYNAMSGLAVRDVDLGLPARKAGSGLMRCEQQMLTGSHVPKWFCRYKDDIDSNRERLQVELTLPRLNFSRQGQGGATVTVMGTGGGGHSQ
jgi:hypothetical protein